MALKNNPLIYLTRKAWNYSKGNRSRVIWYLVLFILANLVSLLEPLFIAYILNTIQSQGVTTENFWQIILLLSSFVILQLLFWLFHGPARVLENNNAFHVRTNYKKYLLEGVMQLPAAWHANHHSGNTIDRIEKGTRALYDFSAGTFIIISNLVSLAGAYFALCYFNLHASYLVIFAVIFTLWMILQFDRVLEKQYSQLNRSENTISEKIYDGISNITTVIILRIEKLVNKEIFQKIIQPFKLYQKNSKLNEVKWACVAITGALMVFLVLSSYVFFRLRAGEVVLFGTVYLLYDYLQRIQHMFFDFAYLYGEKMRQKTQVENAEELTQEFSKLPRPLPSALTNSWKVLEIKNLNFSYHTEEGQDLHLTDINLHISRGQKIAVIGESGSGKTTLFKIIRGLYKPRAGKLLLDHKPLSRGFSAISADIALIPQEPEIFQTTIKNNITVGVTHTDKIITRYTDLAEFTEVISRLPKKIESAIYEKGVNLSGGEKQRLALARGLLASADKEIILLDEPTSSVDFKNELKIYQNIFKQFPDKTIISSIHRLHLISMFDYIYFFKNSRIIAEGTFQDLLKNSEEFRLLWEKSYVQQKSLL